MFKTDLITAIIIGLVFTFAGCNGAYVYQEETMLDRNWGRSYETAKYNQILNPDAGQNMEPAEGLDGVPADANIKKYQKSFEKEQPQQTVNILKLQ
jgi:hypothetical protein